MQIIDQTTEFCIPEKTAVSFGKFDGIHLGHQLLLNALLEKKKCGYQTVVFTFAVPPVETADGALLMTREEKIQFLEQLGIDYLVIFPFHDEIRKMMPEAFIREVIAKKLNAAYLAVGPDFRFGYQRRGDVDLLQNCSTEYGYQVEMFQKVTYQGEPISSSRIRREVEAGNMECATAMLGRPYGLYAEVVHGRALGNTIGFATMNLRWPANRICPPRGVYFIRVQIAGETYAGLANIGLRPTVEKDLSKSDLLLEAHLLQYNRLAYGEMIHASLLHYQRAEQRFSDLAALQKQIQTDKTACQSFFEKRDDDGEETGI